MNTNTPRTAASTRLLAQVLLTVPVAWVLTAPILDVRNLVQSQIRTLQQLAGHGLFDVDAHTAIQPLLMLDGRTAGFERRSYREEVAAALSGIVHELAYRSVDNTPAPVAAVEPLPDVWGPMPGHTDGCNPFGECDTTCETVEVAA